MKQGLHQADALVAAVSPRPEGFAKRNAAGCLFLRNFVEGFEFLGISRPFWPQAARARVDEPLHRYLYARAKVGLNLHVPFQLNDATELNERAYNLAACGVPQLMDNPKSLPERFRPESVYVGATPAECRQQFERMLKRPEEARERALNALEDVYAGHTIFHRANTIMSQLNEPSQGVL